MCTVWQPWHLCLLEVGAALHHNMPTWPASAPKTIMGIRSLVLFVLLSTIATCALAAADTSTCDICKCGKGECDRIRLGDPTRNSSAGQIQVCWGDYWQTICGPTHDESHRFTKNDANVACFQLGFTRAGPTAAVDRGSACKPGQESYLVVGTPCKGWEEQLSDCHLQPAEPSGICTPQTAIDVTCESESGRHSYSFTYGGRGGEREENLVR